MKMATPTVRVTLHNSIFGPYKCKNEKWKPEIIFLVFPVTLSMDSCLLVRVLFVHSLIYFGMKNEI